MKDSNSVLNSVVLQPIKYEGFGYTRLFCGYLACKIVNMLQ